MATEQRRVGSWAFIVLLALLSACGSQPDAGPEGVASEPVRAVQGAEEAERGTARQVRSLVVQQGTLNSSRSASVTIEPAQEAQVAAATSGQVARILKREGERVAAGEVVVQLGDEALQLQVDNARLAVESARVNLQVSQTSSQEALLQAQAALRTAQLNLELARRHFQEGQQLQAAGGLAATELSALEAQLAQSEAAYQQAQDGLARAQRVGGEDLELLNLQLRQAQNQLAQAEKALRDADIAAPFAGEVAEVLVEQGEFIGAGSPAFRLVSLERQLARFRVPPEDAARLLAQELIYIRYNGLDYAAQVRRSSEAPGQTRQVEVTAELYPSDTRIPTGTTTQLDYAVELGSGVLLPAGALEVVGGRSAVYLVEGEQARRQRVEVIAEGGGQAVVGGLEPGSEIVYPLPSDLRDGSDVVVVGDALP